MIRRILIAPDSFKDALPAAQVAQALAEGIRSVRPDLSMKLLPLADGGEGTLDVWKRLTGGTIQYTWVCDPLFRARKARWGLSSDGEIACIEMAEAAGLQLLAPGERNAQFTSTYGVGELINAALEASVKKIYLTLGGSGTNDGGIGMANALGYRFLNTNGQYLLPTGDALSKIWAITGRPHSRLSSTQFIALTDVRNPLLGKEGATYTYGPQKGVSNAQLPILEKGLQRLADLWESKVGSTYQSEPGAGAAGGLGWGSCAFLKARLEPATEQIFSWAQLDQYLAEADLLITGEGRFDGQTQKGKLIAALAKRAEHYKVPLFLACGQASKKALERFPYPIANLEELRPHQQESLVISLEKTASRLRTLGANWASHW